MNLNKWSPLRRTRSDVFRTMEDNHDSLHLPPKPAGDEADKTAVLVPAKTATGLPKFKSSPPCDPPRAG